MICSEKEKDQLFSLRIVLHNFSLTNTLSSFSLCNEVLIASRNQSIHISYILQLQAVNVVDGEYRNETDCAFLRFFSSSHLVNCVTLLLLGGNVTGIESSQCNSSYYIITHRSPIITL
jgi:hypothetical protein